MILDELAKHGFDAKMYHLSKRQLRLAEKCILEDEGIIYATAGNWGDILLLRVADILLLTPKRVCYIGLFIHAVAIRDVDRVVVKYDNLFDTSQLKIPSLPVCRFLNEYYEKIYQKVLDNLLQINPQIKIVQK